MDAVLPAAVQLCVLLQGLHAKLATEVLMLSCRVELPKRPAELADCEVLGLVAMGHPDLVAWQTASRIVRVAQVTLPLCS